MKLLILLRWMEYRFRLMFNLPVDGEQFKNDQGEDLFADRMTFFGLVRVLGFKSAVRYQLRMACEGVDYWDDPEEYRCSSCSERFSCPAAFTGVVFPCPYYANF